MNIVGRSMSGKAINLILLPEKIKFIPPFLPTHPITISNKVRPINTSENNNSNLQ
jgi:hypothetical protein